MNKRDLKEDLEKFEKINKIIPEPCGDFIRDVVAPHALQRAIAAEEEVERLKEENERLRDTLYQVQVQLSRESYMAAEDIVDSAIQRIQEEGKQCGEQAKS